MQRPIYFTGTGTDIGKTHILCAVLKSLRAAGQSARVLKPVASGFDPDFASRTDTIRLLKANGQELNGATVKAMTPWRFKPAMSPDMAARHEGRELLLEPIVDWCFDHVARDRPTLIEGAGGVMSPIAENGLNLDLIRELDARPVLVTGAYLGTISHTLTALRALDTPCTVVINELEKGPVPPQETASVISRFNGRADVHIYDQAGLPGLVEALLEPQPVS
jgi:dethiobiotin synthetase